MIYFYNVVANNIFYSKTQLAQMLLKDLSIFKLYMYFMSTFSVHGGWSEWVRYGRCNADSCQTGQQLRTRVCNNPRPQHRGLMCRGNSVEQTECFNNDGTCKSELKLMCFAFDI